MGRSSTEPEWLRAERTYEDDLFRRGTIPELFEESAERHADADAQLYKGGIAQRSLAGTAVPRAPSGEYASLTYGELRGIVRRLAAGFRDLDLSADDRVAIFSSTRMEWAQADLALLAAGCVVTTVYTDSSPEQVRYLLGDPEVSAVVVEDGELLERVLEVEDDLDVTEYVLLDEPQVDRGREDVHTLADVYERGQKCYDHSDYVDWLDARDPDDLASIVYTSGTTDEPKGVELTHWNFRSNVHQVQRRIGPRPDKAADLPTIDSESTSISFLPLAHVFERLGGHFTMLGSGATVGYAESPDTLPADLQQIQPTVGASVPRVYERIFESMREEAGEGLRRRIFEWAVDVATAYQRAETPGPLLRTKHAVADRLVYSTVRERLGGNVEFMVSGGGSLSEELCRLFDGMGITIIEGYGLTETAPVISVNPPEDVRPGTMGYPVVGVDVFLDESRVADGQFEDATGPIGELLVRGDNVTDGYWSDPDATEAAFTDSVPTNATDDWTGNGRDRDRDADGSGKWFRTGDVVERTPDGYLIFRDRLKQVLVLSTGKNVAPAPIEDRFATNDRVDQVMVLGDGRKFVAALVVPNFDRLRAWADENDVSLPENRDDLIEDERVVAWVEEAVEAVNADLERVARVKDFELVPEEWTPENDLLTPSMKKKRRNIHDVYADRIERLYETERTAAAETPD